MTIPKRPPFIQSKDRDADVLHAEANNQRLEHVMTLLEHILKTLQSIEKQGKYPKGSAGGDVQQRYYRGIG